MIRKFMLVTLLTSSFIGLAQNPTALENLGKNVNSTYSEVRPTVSADGKTLYFVVEGHPKNTLMSVTNKAQDIWYSEKDNSGNWQPARHASATLNSQKSNAVFWASPDGKRLLVRGAFENGKYLGRGFSISQKTDTGWSAPQRLKIKDYNIMCQDAYSGATLSNDGKTLLMYFSEEKNSYINDIYVSFLTDNDDWTRPMKLDEPINTEEYNEITPFLASDGISLYFSSDRPGGKGDHDIWKVKRLDDSWKKWSAPENVSSVNTPKWEAYFTIDASGENAYISTADGSLGGTDIAGIKLEEKERPKPVVLMYGKVYNAATGKEISADLFYDLIPGEQNEGRAVANPEDGSYKIVLPYGKAYRLRAATDNFFPVLDTVDFSKIDKYQELHRDIYLTPADVLAKESEKRVNIDSINANPEEYPIEAGMIVSLENILFDFNKSLLRAESYKELDKAVRMLKSNPSMEIELSAHTDNKGGFSYNVKLSEDRAYGAKQYLISKGIADSRVKSKGYGEVKPVSDNNSEQGRQLNRRVEFRVLKN